MVGVINVLISAEDIVPLLFLALPFGYFLYIVFYILDLFFLNPFKRIPPLTEKEERLIASQLPFFNQLSISKKEKFKKRVVRFRKRKKIDFHEDVEEREKITLLLSATAAMLTLGMADFLILSIKRVIVYPTQYYSRITKKDHYGEYNPGLKTIVFSADHLLEGFRIPNDNRNLAVHEFAHAISFNVANKFYTRSYVFLLGLKKIKWLFKNPEFNRKMEESGYFRAYGKTNVHEFFAVAVENFVETPEVFENQFPKLYRIIKRMLNFGFYRMPEF